MQVLLAHDIPVASSCLGKGVCGKCRIDILKGAHQLPKETQLEIDIRKRNNIPEGKRISCQTAVTCDISIDTPYW